jgi:ribosomal protein S18 acetylase RimI-like enzyme
VLGGSIGVLLWCFGATSALGQPLDAGDGDAAIGAAPPARATLTYHLRQTVSGGTGTYAGYRDALTSVGRYTLEGGAVHARYDWDYESTERTDRGTVERDVRFDPVTREYAGPTDLDEYDRIPGPHATWMWIPPSLAIGDSVRILNNTFAVAEREEVTVAGAPRSALRLYAVAEGERHDNYGDFRTEFTDTYWFDAQTGMFLREQRHERNTSPSGDAGFEVDLLVEVVDASYAPAVGPIPPAPEATLASRARAEPYDPPDSQRERSPLAAVVCWGFGGLVLAGFLGLAGLIVRTLWRSSRLKTRLHARGAPMPPGIEALSPHFGPFLPSLVELAHATGNRVAFAIDPGNGNLAGLAVDDQDVRLAAIYTRYVEVAERLRSTLNRDELIAEQRYAKLPSVEQALKDTKQTSSTEPHAYNLYESFDVLGRSGPLESLDYDASVVSRLKDDDLAGAGALATSVLGVPCDSFVRASVAAGDVAFVAKDQGRVVGLALATVAGTAARLHTLVVHPDARSRGLGKELYRARLRALADLGVESVITEVAVNNPAAMAIARQYGMAKVGEMHVQSARGTHVPFTAVRR